MKIGINASGQLLFPDLEALHSHAAAAAEAGFASWWLAQTGLVDALTVFASLGDRAPGIELGTAVIPTFPRHPSMLAAQALTTQSAVGGRLALGIGLSHKPAVEGNWGLAFDRPVRHLIDYLEILQALLTEGQATFEGEVFTMRSETMARPTEDPPEVLVAALGPQVLNVAGRRTAGTVLWMVGPRTIAEHIAPRLNEAAAAADRPRPRIVCSLPVCVTDDVAGVEAFTAEALKIYGELPSYRAMLDREGAAGPAQVSVFGSEDQVTERLNAIGAAGATEFTAVELALNEDDAARTRAVLKQFAAAQTVG